MKLNSAFPKIALIIFFPHRARYHHIALWMVYYQLGERSHMNTGMSRGRKELCFDLH